MPGREFFSGRFFVGRSIGQGGTHARVEPKDLPPRNPPGACRHAALAVRRDVGGAVPHPGLRLRQRRGMRGALLRQDPGLRLFALLQPDHGHVRAAHGRARRRRGRALDRDRHGGGHHRADGPGARRRSRRRRQGAVRLLPLGDRGMAAALRRRLDAGRRHRPRRLEERGAHEHQGVLPGNADQSDAGGLRHRRDRRDRAQRRRQAGGRQCVRHAALPEPARRSAPTVVVYSATKHIDGQGRVLGGVILGSEKFIIDNVSPVDAADRAVAVAVQRLGAAQGTGDAAGARRAADRKRRRRRRRARRPQEDQRG